MNPIPREKTNRRAMITWLLIFALAAAATAFADESTDQPPVRLRVGYIPIAECAHLYVGIAKKFFEREGLEIELQPMSGGAVILPAVQNGSLDIGFTNVASIIILNSKLPRRDDKSFVSVAGASYERPGNCNHALLVKKGRTLPLAALADGKTRIAVNTNRNIEELMLRRFLTHKGFSTQNLYLNPLSFPDMLSALERGDVDVISEVEPFIEPVLRSGRASLLARQYLEVSPNTVVATYGAARGWLQKNEEIAARFRRAFLKADAFIKGNDAETRQIIGSFTRIAKADLPIIGMAAFEPAVSKESVRELIREMRQHGFISGEVVAEDLMLDYKN